MGLACENAEEDSRKSRRSHERRPRIELATSSTAATLVFAWGENNQVKPPKRGDYLLAAGAAPGASSQGRGLAGCLDGANEPESGGCWPKAIPCEVPRPEPVIEPEARLKKRNQRTKKAGKVTFPPLW